MKCLSCGKEMRATTIGGCYQCDYCGFGIDDLVYRITTPQPAAQFVDLLNTEMHELKISSLEQENSQLKEENRVLDLALNNLLKMYKTLFDKRFGKIIETKNIEYIRQQLLRQAKEKLK